MNWFGFSPPFSTKRKNAELVCLSRFSFCLNALRVLQRSGRGYSQARFEKRPLFMVAVGNKQQNVPPFINTSAS